MLCYSMSQLTAFGVWLCAVVVVFPWNKILSALAEQLSSGVMCVAKVPVHFIVTILRRKEKTEQSHLNMSAPNLLSAVFLWVFTCI